MPQKFLLPHLSDTLNLRPPPQRTRTFSPVFGRCHCWLCSTSTRGGDRAEVTFELLDHVLVVLDGLLQDHLRLVHLPAPLGAHGVCVVPEGRGDSHSLSLVTHLQKSPATCRLGINNIQSNKKFPATSCCCPSLWLSPLNTTLTPLSLQALVSQKEEWTLWIIFNFIRLF